MQHFFGHRELRTLPQFIKRWGFSNYGGYATTLRDGSYYGPLKWIRGVAIITGVYARALHGGAHTIRLTHEELPFPLVGEAMHVLILGPFSPITIRLGSGAWMPVTRSEFVTALAHVSFRQRAYTTFARFVRTYAERTQRAAMVRYKCLMMCANRTPGPMAWVAHQAGGVRIRLLNYGGGRRRPAVHAPLALFRMAADEIWVPPQRKQYMEYSSYDDFY
jgi:hypothetical protein